MLVKGEFLQKLDWVFLPFIYPIIAALYIGFASLYPVIEKIPEPRWIRTIDFHRQEAVFTTKLLTHINNIYYILNVITLQYFSFINKSISMNSGWGDGIRTHNLRINSPLR